MPRIAEARPAAEPSSADQKARHRRILRAAARLGAEKGLAGMQMHDVAREAGVAIATLYRYFPSKTHLFTSVMAEQVTVLRERTPPPGPGRDPVEGVYRLLVDASRRLLRRPLLAHAMLQCNQSARAATVQDATRIDRAFEGLLLRTLGIERPTDHDVTLVRLLERCWYGVLISTLNGRTSMSDAERELRIACELLLAPRSNAPDRPPAPDGAGGASRPARPG